MSPLDLSPVPETFHDAVRVALRELGGATSIVPIIGGASGALTYRVHAATEPLFLRIEANRTPMRNPHQYACLQAAAAAGIAPPVRYLDAEGGVLVMPLVDVVATTEFPGGPPALVTAAAELVARLHELGGFADFGDHFDNLGRMLGFLAGSGRVGAGLLAQHQAAFAAVRAAYPWDRTTFVAAHNDPNQFNLLFDGTRLWLIDWETACRNDPFIDLATLCSHLAPTPDLRDEVLRVGLRRAPTELDYARLTLMELVIKLFGGTILLLITSDPASPVQTDLAALTPAEFGAKVARGEFVPSQPNTTIAFAKMLLAQALCDFESPSTQRALRVAAG